MPRVTKDNVDDCFKYHGPDEAQVEKYAAINDAAKAMAKVILDVCPASRESSVAMTQLQDMRMWANASIALEHVTDK